MVPGHEAGNFLGPTLLANVTMDMDVWREEIFAPVLVCLEVHSCRSKNQIQKKSCLCSSVLLQAWQAVFQPKLRVTSRGKTAARRSSCRSHMSARRCALPCMPGL